MQLPLPIHQIDDETLDNFYAENSFLLLNSLRQNFEQVQQPFFYIWGKKSSGKSHLLKAVSNHFLLNHRPSSYIPLKKSYHFSPMVLDNADQMAVVCLDDIQTIAGNDEWELAIFNLFNQIREQQGLFGQEQKTLLLISADCPPTQLKIKLPDLRSRLMWGEIYQLTDLTEQQKCIILQRTAHAKGLELTDEAAHFLIKRLSHDLHILLEELERLDRASLQAKRNLTVPFIKEIWGLS